MAAIKFDQLKKQFGKVKALDGVSFEVNDGEIFGFLGPNGAGKTTTIRCMLDFLRPTSGSITIKDLDSQKNSAELKKIIGYVSAEMKLYDKWTGEDHLTYVKKLHGITKPHDELAQLLQLDTHKKSQQLSTGNKQKLALMMALTTEPEILILDEPTSGLDPLLQQKIYKILRDFADQGNTVFMSSHNLSEVDKVCNRVGIVRNGKLIAVEKISTLKKKQVYRVQVSFDQKVDKDQISDSGIDVIRELDSGFVIDVKGDINLLIEKLSPLHITDLEVLHGNLERIFLEYYE